MNQDYYTTASNDQKPNSRSSSVAMTDADLEATKRRRLVESAPASTTSSNSSSGSSNNMFRPTAWQSALLQKQLASFITPSSSSPSSKTNSPNMTRSQSSSTVSSIKSESPTPIHSMTNLHIASSTAEQQQQTKSRHEIYLDQLRLREEYKRRQREALAQQAQEFERIKTESSNKKTLIDDQQVAAAMMRQRMELNRQQQQQQQQIMKKEDDDDIMVDEEMTNRNICIGMVTTDIVPEKSPLILIRDDQYEIVSLESEGKLNTDNYSFRVTSRSQPPRFYGWILFRDTNILGPLVDERLIWWDAVIPRGKATNSRTPLCIILYCRPHSLGRVAKHFEAKRLYLKTPPFYNPACRYSNPHQHILDQMYQMQQQQYRPYSSNYAGYQYQPNGPYTSNHRYRQEDGERQSRKDIEMLLSSIPNDVPQILLRKKKKQRLAEKRKAERRKKKLNADVIEILDDDEEEEEEKDFEEEEEEEEEEDSGYVEGLDIHLMDHQIKGVSWMIDRENNQSSNGGILADMGLGKTIQTMALIASTMTSEDASSPKSADTNNEKEATLEEKAEEQEEEYKGRKMTLIVAPLALIHQWVDEIESKTEPGKLRVLKHHGPNRTKNPAVFRLYDVVVTTYQVVASDMPSSSDKKSKKKKKPVEDGSSVNEEEDETEEAQDEEEEMESTTTSRNSSRNNSPFPSSKFTPLKKDHGPLFQIKWYRVVLDEAQFIKNRLTKASISCATLNAVKRWCLTGTPIQNNVDELYSLLRFLRIQPLSEYATFKKTISIPMQNGDYGIAMSRLKAVLMAVMLRRTKSVLSTAEATATAESTTTKKEAEQQDVDDPMTGSTDSGTNTPTTTEENATLSKKLSLQLPTRTKQDVLLQFSDHEKGLYDILSRKTKDTIQSMVGKQNGYMNILCLLLRLRQACDHPQLVLKSIDNDKDVLDIVSSDNTINTNHWSSSQRLCELCGRSNHHSQKNDTTSPYCMDCTAMIQSASSDSDSTTESSSNKNSTKIKKIIDILKETREANPGEKTIIFSQFTSMLDLMEKSLNQEGFKFCRYDGSMSSQLRERSLTTLKYDSKCTVMLISLKCGSLGLNLTAANRVILVDIWWNPAVEEQAIDRVHRIGQRLPVHVTRLLIDKTVELKIIKLQEKKAQLSKGALSDGLVKSTKLTASEIRSLFDL